jgi:two-component system NtrC family sensor kinase
MSLVRNMAIKHKLMSIIMATCTAVLLLSGAIQLLFLRGEYRKGTVDSISCFAEMIGDNCRAALAFADAEDAEEMLKSLQAESSIVFACVYTKEQKMLARYHRPGFVDHLSPPTCEVEGYRFEGNYFQLFKQVEDGDDLIGTVYIQLDLSEGKTRLWLKAGSIALVVLVCSLMAYLVSLRLQAVISGPILSLAKVAKTVSGKKDYSTRASKQSNDEVGSLIDAFNEMLEQIQQRDSALIEAKDQLEARVKKRTTELRAAQEKIVESAHRAGMAEVATDVLHNVGNVLNSINVSAKYIQDKILNSKVTNLKKVIDMLSDHIDDLGAFLTKDERGRHIPVYLTEATKLIIHEHAGMIEKLGSLTKNVEHIKQIIKAQQGYARAGGVEMFINMTEVIEDAIEINSASLARHGVDLKLDLAELPKIRLDKQRVLQILVNLISNAKHALSKNEQQEKVLAIRCYRHGEDRLRIDVEDNGVGISNENTAKIFRHGFTTREGGHGFGLHSSALAAKDMGGSLAVHSDGPGRGASFTLELPLKMKQATGRSQDGESE